jgi:tripartite-type tricarboxylate transporter receptor subunit TctC
MPLPSPRRRALSTALALSPFTSLPTFAQPTLPKQITLLVPQNAGGSNDVMARAIAARLPRVLGEGYNAVVENRTGAGGNVGTAYVAKQAPKDGSVWLVTVNSAQAINPALYKTTGFDPIADFEPVAGISLVQHAIVAAPQLPVNTLKDLVELARQQPGKLTYGSSGNGTFSHLLMEILKKQQKVFITHIPYRGVAPALTDIIAGNVSCMVATIPSCLQFIQGGKLKALAVPSLHRAPALPNVPLANETVPGLVGELMVLMYAPKGTPREHIEQMRRAVATVQAMPEMETFFTAQGATALKAGPAEVAQLTREELAKWGPVVRESGMKID